MVKKSNDEFIPLPQLTTVDIEQYFYNIPIQVNRWIKAPEQKHFSIPAGKHPINKEYLRKETGC